MLGVYILVQPVWHVPKPLCNNMGLQSAVFVQLFCTLFLSVFMSSNLYRTYFHHYKYQNTNITAAYLKLKDLCLYWGYKQSVYWLLGKNSTIFSEAVITQEWGYSCQHKRKKLYSKTNGLVLTKALATYLANPSFFGFFFIYDLIFYNVLSDGSCHRLVWQLIFFVYKTFGDVFEYIYFFKIVLLFLF